MDLSLSLVSCNYMLAKEGNKVNKVCVGCKLTFNHPAVTSVFAATANYLYRPAGLKERVGWIPH